MALIRELAIVFIVISCIAATVNAGYEDGLPRPEHFPDEPMTTYGSGPEVLYGGSPVDCTWYGFASEQYDASVGLTCLRDLRQGLLDITDDTALEPFVYYYLQRPTGWYPATKEAFCYQGCFNLNSGALPPDSGAFPPSYFNGAPALSYFRGPSPAPFYWSGAPSTELDFDPPPTSGA